MFARKANHNDEVENNEGKSKSRHQDSDHPLLPLLLDVNGLHLMAGAHVDPVLDEQPVGLDQEDDEGHQEAED